MTERGSGIGTGGLGIHAQFYASLTASGFKALSSFFRISSLWDPIRGFEIASNHFVDREPRTPPRQCEAISEW